MRIYCAVAAALMVLSACGGGNTAENTSTADAAATTLAENAAPAPEEAELEPLSPEQQAATNAQINLDALRAYRDFAEIYKNDNGTYPMTKRNFRSAIGAFEDAAEANLPEGERANLDLPEGAEMTKPGAIVYRSDGTDYKLIAQRTGDCSVIRQLNPKLVDPKRDYGPGDCVAYGYWTSGAEGW